MCASSAFTSFTGNRKPFSPGRIREGIPPASEPATGMPTAMDKGVVLISFGCQCSRLMRSELLGWENISAGAITRRGERGAWRVKKSARVLRFGTYKTNPTQ